MTLYCVYGLAIPPLFAVAEQLSVDGARTFTWPIGIGNVCAIAMSLAAACLPIYVIYKKFGDPRDACHNLQKFMQRHSEHRPMAFSADHSTSFHTQQAFVMEFYIRPFTKVFISLISLLPVALIPPIMLRTGVTATAASQWGAAGFYFVFALNFTHFPSDTEWRTMCDALNRKIYPKSVPYQGLRYISKLNEDARFNLQQDADISAAFAQEYAESPLLDHWVGVGQAAFDEWDAFVDRKKSDQ